MATEESNSPEDVLRKSMGLYGKYIVYKVTSFDHEGQPADTELVTEPVFVLRPLSDLHAREALLRYAQSCYAEGYHALAGDLIQLVTKAQDENIASKANGAIDQELEGYDGFGAPIAKSD